MVSTQDKVAAEASSDGFRVSPLDGGLGPESVIAAAARGMIGQIERTREDLAEQGSQRELLARGKRKARLFNMGRQEDADAYSELMTKHAAGEVIFQENRDLVDGINLARFLSWVEFDKSLEAVRADVSELGKKFIASIKSRRKVKAPEVPVVVVEEKKPTRKPRRRKDVVVELDSLPTGFRSLAQKDTKQ